MKALRFGLPQPPSLAHRLDRDTSGCLVLGRHRKALARVGRLFQQGAVEKVYWAVVRGRPKEAEGTVDLALRKRSEVRGWWMEADPAGQTARTDYRLLGEGGGLSAAAQQAVEPLLPLIDSADKNVAIVLSQQKALTEVGQSLRAINKQSGELLDLTDTLSALKLQQGASAAELATLGQLAALSQRIGKSASEFITLEGINPEAVYLLGRDLKSFRETAEGISAGGAQARERLVPGWFVLGKHGL